MSISVCAYHGPYAKIGAKAPIPKRFFKCPHHGEQSIDYKFCPECGTKLISDKKIILVDLSNIRTMYKFVSSPLIDDVQLVKVNDSVIIIDPDYVTYVEQNTAWEYLLPDVSQQNMDQFMNSFQLVFDDLKKISSLTVHYGFLHWIED